MKATGTFVARGEKTSIRLYLICAVSHLLRGRLNTGIILSCVSLGVVLFIPTILFSCEGRVANTVEVLSVGPGATDAAASRGVGLRLNGGGRGLRRGH